MDARATVIIPTFGQASFARWAIQSVRMQSIEDIEICVICDGSPDSMVAFFETLAQDDPRMRVFAFPKSPRTGEPYRDRVIRQTTGRIICYCCHDDLWLPNHLQVMEDALKTCRFAHSLHAPMNLPENVRAGQRLFRKIHLENIRHPATVRDMFRGINHFGLTCGTHTRDSYSKLEEGWVTTPLKDVPTDLYMWRKFLAAFLRECRTVMKITSLHFMKKSRESWSEQQRDEELKHYCERIQDPGFAREVSRCLWRARIKSLFKRHRRRDRRRN